MKITQNQRSFKKINLHRDFMTEFLKYLKSNSTSNFFGPCYLGIKCKDKICMLIGLNDVCCKTCSIYIHQKCSISLDLVIIDQHYCCHDC